MHAVKKMLDRVLAFASVVLFTALVAAVTWQVFTRQVLNDPATWTEEGARYIFVCLGFLAAALVFSERGHIAVDLAVSRFPAAVQRAIAVIVQVSIIGFAVIVLCYGGWRAALGAWSQNLSSLPTQVGVIYLIMPVTGVFITFYAVYHMATILSRQEPAIERAADSGAE